MADDQVERSSLKAHVQTYDGVIALFKWGTMAAVIVAALVIWLIAH
ncbi:aa3-type cytochrome c oxidase subunit IV [Sphingomonas sp.]